MVQRNVKRCPIRFRDGDCPDEVADIFDHPQFGDRYTVVYRDVICGTHVGYRAMSAYPSHPQGIGLYCEWDKWEFSNYRQNNRRKRVKWTDLPEAVRKCVKGDCNVVSK